VQNETDYNEVAGFHHVAHITMKTFILTAALFLYLVCSFSTTTSEALAAEGGNAINVMDIGAQGDSITDDSAAFNAALEKADPTAAPKQSCWSTSLTTSSSIMSKYGMPAG
jgi:hypothetical protein